MCLSWFRYLSYNKISVLMPGVFRDLHKLEWLYVSFLLKLQPPFLLSFYYTFLLMLFHLHQYSANEAETVSCVCSCFRILENNNIHHISSMTFSGLNSLLLLWVVFCFFLLMLYDFLFFALLWWPLKSSKVQPLRAFVDLQGLTDCSVFWTLWENASCFILSVWLTGFCWTTLWQSWMTSVGKCPNWTGCK